LAQKTIYGFGTKQASSMAKDPRFFTPEVDHSMNIINECDKEEHSRMRRMLSSAFSISNLLSNEDVLIRRTDEFLRDIGGVDVEDGKRGMNIVRKFNYVTFNIMGEMSFGDSWERRLKEQSGQSTRVLCVLTPDDSLCRTSLSLGGRNRQINVHERRHAGCSVHSRPFHCSRNVPARPQQKDSLSACCVRDRTH